MAQREINIVIKTDLDNDSINNEINNDSLKIINYYTQALNTVFFFILIMLNDIKKKAKWIKSSTNILQN